MADEMMSMTGVEAEKLDLAIENALILELLRL